MVRKQNYPSICKESIIVSRVWLLLGFLCVLIFFNKENLIDPSKAFAQFIKNDLETNDLINNNINGSEKFYVSSNPENFKTASKLFCELNDLPELIKF